MITEKNIRDAINAARDGELGYKKYDQSRWCGTACCVLGFARILAGHPELNRGPRDGEIEDTPACRRLTELMECASPEILGLMERVDKNGMVDLRGLPTCVGRCSCPNERCWRFSYDHDPLHG